MSVDADDLRQYLPTVDRIAADLYGIHFGRDYRALCLDHDDHNPSLYHDRRKDRIFCTSHQCFGEKGADAFKLVQVREKCRFPEACKLLAEVYAPHLLSASRASAGKPDTATKRTDTGTPVISTEARARMDQDGWQLIAEYDFGPGLRKARFEHRTEKRAKGKPKKTCLWEHLKDGIWYTTKGGRKNPVYLNQVARECDQLESAVGFEGENKAESAGGLGYAAFSFKDLTGENAAQMAGMDLTLWRDKDQDGLKLQIAAIKHLTPHARSIRIVDPAQLEDLPEKGDIIDALAAGYTPERIASILKSASLIDSMRPTDRPAPLKPKVLSLDDIMKLEVKKAETLVEGIIPIPGCTIVVGREKAGKTLLAVQLGISIATGTPLFPTFPVTKPGPVMVVEVDDPAGAASVRLLLDKTDVPIKGAPFFTVDEPGMTLSEAFVDWLRDQILMRGLRAVILDSYTQLRPARKAGGDLVKTESSEMTMLDSLGKETNCAIILSHHESKGGSGLDWSARAAGTFAITAAVEAIISVARFQDLEGDAPERWVRIRGRHIKDRELVIRLRPQFLNFELVLDNTAAGVYPQIRQLEAAFGKTSFSPKQVEQETGLSRASTFRLLGRLTAAGIIRKDGRGDYRFDTWP